MPQTASHSGRAPRVAIVVSRYNHSITRVLLNGALASFRERFGIEADVYPAPGAYELPFLAAAAATSDRYDGVVALGCVIRGETKHDRYINHAVAQGIASASLASGVPIAFGVLTVENAKQAKDRAGGKHGNKGAEAMEALLASLDSLARINTGKPFDPAAIFAKPSKDKSAPRQRTAKLATANGARHGHTA